MNGKLNDLDPNYDSRSAGLAKPTQNNTMIRKIPKFPRFEHHDLKISRKPDLTSNRDGSPSRGSSTTKE